MDEELFELFKKDASEFLDRGAERYYKDKNMFITDMYLGEREYEELTRQFKAPPVQFISCSGTFNVVPVKLPSYFKFHSVM